MPFVVVEDGLSTTVPALACTPLSRVSVSLDLRASKRLVRRLSSHWTSALAHVGGLLALFCGFSLVCLFELLYFCTFRLWDNFRDPMLRKQDGGEN